MTGVGALWVDGAFWFETGDGTRTARNVARRVGASGDTRGRP